MTDFARRSAASTPASSTTTALDLSIIVLLGLCIRALLWRPDLAIEADGVSRILIAEDWLRSPSLISSGIWGPLHTYLLAASTLIFGDRLLASTSIDTAVTILTSVLLYLLCRGAGNRFAGWVAAVLWMSNSLVLRLSIEGVSEPIFVSLVAASLWSLGRCLAPVPAARLAGISWLGAIGRVFGGAPQAEIPAANFSYALLGGLCMTLASAVRYEAWLLIPVVTVLLARYDLRAAAGFAVMAALYPVFWCVGSYLATGDALYGIHANTVWVTQADGFVPGGPPKVLLLKATYLPLAFLFGFTLIPIALLILAIKPALTRGGISTIAAACLLLLLAVIAYQRMFGYLLPRPRYVLVLFMLAIAVIGMGIPWPWRLAGANRALVLGSFAVAAALNLALPVVFSALPKGWGATALGFTTENRIQPQTAELATRLRGELMPGELLILDFWDWNETYNAALRGTSSKNLVSFLPGGSKETIDVTLIRGQICHYQRGLIVLAASSAFENMQPVNAARTEVLSVDAEVSELQPVGSLRLFRFKVSAAGCAANG